MLCQPSPVAPQVCPEKSNEMSTVSLKKKSYKKNNEHQWTLEWNKSAFGRFQATNASWIGYTLHSNFLLSPFLASLCRFPKDSDTLGTGQQSTLSTESPPWYTTLTIWVLARSRRIVQCPNLLIVEATQVLFHLTLYMLTSRIPPPGHGPILSKESRAEMPVAVAGNPHSTGTLGHFKEEKHRRLSK